MQYHHLKHSKGTVIHTVDRSPHPSHERAHLHKYESAKFALDYLVKTLYRHHLEVSVPVHLRFEETNFRHDNNIFLRRVAYWPSNKKNDVGTMVKEVTLYRSLHELSTQFGCGTAKKMIALLTKLLKRENMDYEVWNTVVHNMDDAHPPKPGGGDGAGREKNAESSALKTQIDEIIATIGGVEKVINDERAGVASLEAQKPKKEDETAHKERINALKATLKSNETKLKDLYAQRQRLESELSKHPPRGHNLDHMNEKVSEFRRKQFLSAMIHPFEGIDVKSLNNEEMQAYFQDQARSTIDYLEWTMTYHFYILNEFHKFADSLRLSNQDHMFAKPVIETGSTDATIRTVRERLIRAYNIALGSDHTGTEAKSVEGTIQGDALEVACIKVYLEYYTEFHNEVLYVMAVFCNALHMQEHLPKLIFLYRASILQLTNEKKMDNFNFKKLFGLFSNIFNLVKEDPTQEGSYLHDLKNRVKVTLTSNIGGKNGYLVKKHSNAELLANPYLRKDSSLQARLKKAVHLSLRPEIPHFETTLEEISVHYNVHRPSIATREHGRMITSTVQHLRLRDIFLGQNAFSDFADVMRYGPRIIELFNRFFNPRNEVLQDWSTAQTLNLSFVGGGLNFPHRKITENGTFVNVSSIIDSNAQSKFQECKSMLQALKDSYADNPASLSQSETFKTSDHLEKQTEAFENKNTDSVKAALALNYPEYGQLRTSVLRFIMDNACHKAEQRVDWEIRSADAEVGVGGVGDSDQLVEGGSDEVKPESPEQVDRKSSALVSHQKLWYRESWDRLLDLVFAGEGYDGKGTYIPTDNNKENKRFPGFIDFRVMQHALQSGTFTLTQTMQQPKLSPQNVPGLHIYVGPKLIFEKFQSNSRFKTLTYQEQVKDFSDFIQPQKNDAVQQPDSRFVEELNPDSGPPDMEPERKVKALTPGRKAHAGNLALDGKKAPRSKKLEHLKNGRAKVGKKNRPLKKSKKPAKGPAHSA